MPAALRYVPVGDLDYWWPLVEPLLQRAVVDGDVGTDEIRERAEAGTMRLWIGEAACRVAMAAATTEIEIGTERAVHIVALGGDDMGEWLQPCLAEFERLARLNGIARVRLTGRRGWSRVMPGYREASVTLEKCLDG